MESCLRTNAETNIEERCEINITLPNPRILEIERRMQEISFRLSEIDMDSIRPLRAKMYGNATQTDNEKLTALESEAISLRTEYSLIKKELDGLA